MYDVIIVGAGPAGTSAALYAHRLGLNCILLDKAVFPRDKICGDALSGKSVRIMRELDILDELDNLDGSEINRITFGSPKNIQFDVNLKGTQNNNYTNPQLLITQNKNVRCCMIVTTDILFSNYSFISIVL